jgi:hypothetical protein
MPTGTCDSAWERNSALTIAASWPRLSGRSCASAGSSTPPELRWIWPTTSSTLNATNIVAKPGAKLRRVLIRSSA